MCKNAFKSLFGGGDASQAAAAGTALTARPVGSVVKATDTQRDPGAVISKKKKADEQGIVPGLGL